MAVFTAAYKTNGGRLAALAIISFVLHPFRRFEILKTSKSSAVWLIAGNGIADKPTGEHRRLDSGRWPLGIVGIDRWRPKLRRSVTNQAAVRVGEALVQQPRQPLLFD